MFYNHNSVCFHGYCRLCLNFANSKSALHTISPKMDYCYGVAQVALVSFGGGFLAGLAIARWQRRGRRSPTYSSWFNGPGLLGRAHGSLEWRSLNPGSGRPIVPLPSDTTDTSTEIRVTDYLPSDLLEAGSALTSSFHVDPPEK